MPYAINMIYLFLKIYLVSILLLSIITERLVYCIFEIRNKKNAYNSINAEKDKAQKPFAALLIALFVSIAYFGIALSFNYFSVPPLLLVVLIISTAFIISFGAEFWHALLLTIQSAGRNSRKDVSPESSIQSSHKQSKTEAVFGGFKKLTHEQQREAINELILDQAPILKDKFPEIQSFSAMRKEVKNKRQAFYSIHMDVVEKKKELSDNDKIPEYIDYTTKNGIRYSIPTDISGVGINRLSDYIGEGEMPKKLGLSCSRFNSNTSGTIGLKVYKNGKPETPYLLSCFHVLCAPELKKRQTVFKSDNDINSSYVIVSPGIKDAVDKSNCVPIATVTEGYLKRNLDVAIAKLNNDAVLANSYYNDNGSPKGFYKVNSKDVTDKMDVYLVGKTSGTDYGKLRDNYRAIVYFKDYPAEKINHLQGLIVTDKISKPGDSGASVTNDKNEVIGILVGSNSKQSFLIPISTILNQLHLSIY